MKALPLHVILILAAVLGFLAACSPPAPATRHPAAAGSLETAEAYLAIGDGYADDRDYDRAILDFDRAIQLQPSLSQAYSNRGNAHLRLGHIGQALADFRQARAQR
jgi:tetratricopeptide (TPR) repeat protein